MAELLSDEDVVLEHEAMMKCRDCKAFVRELRTLRLMRERGLFTAQEFGDLIVTVSRGEGRHWEDRHPRYSGHLDAISEHNKRRKREAIHG